VLQIFAVALWPFGWIFCNAATTALFGAWLKLCTSVGIALDPSNFLSLVEKGKASAPEHTLQHDLAIANAFESVVSQSLAPLIGMSVGTLLLVLWIICAPMLAAFFVQKLLTDGGNMMVDSGSKMVAGMAGKTLEVAGAATGNPALAQTGKMASTAVSSLSSGHGEGQAGGSAVEGMAGFYSEAKSGVSGGGGVSGGAGGGVSSAGSFYGGGGGGGGGGAGPKPGSAGGGTVLAAAVYATPMPSASQGGKGGGYSGNVDSGAPL
jgi:hypothetical protein